MAPHRHVSAASHAVPRLLTCCLLTVSTICYACTLSQHEATFDDSMAADALRKSHCTTGEALAVARSMQARTVILTHFSQRYPRVPMLSAEQRVAVAFDGMVVELSAASAMQAVTGGLIGELLAGAGAAEAQAAAAASVAADSCAASSDAAAGDGI
eukprot:7835-Heterococcus_DN1.PRE.2